MNEEKVASISDLVEYVTSSTRTSNKLWFRGVRCSEWHLEPSLWRALKASGTPNLTIDQIMRVEARLITRFRQQSLPYWPAGYNQSEWEHLCVMQHHGVPTRLLDWTTSLLTALYFALESSPDSTHGHACVPTIWILDPVVLNRTNQLYSGYPHIGVLSPTDMDVDRWLPPTQGRLQMNMSQVIGREPIAMYGLYNNDRIASQQGMFTVFGQVITPLDELEQSERYLRKVIVETELSKLREHLELLGVHKSRVYPGLSSYAEDLTKEEFE